MQWYARFYLGRRSGDDERQIKRSIGFKETFLLFCSHLFSPSLSFENRVGCLWTLGQIQTRVGEEDRAEGGGLG